MHPVEFMDEVKALQAAPAGAGETPKPPAPRKSFKAATCDLCTDLSMPSCVYACPHDAARRVDPLDYFAKEFTTKARWQPVKFDPRTTHQAETEIFVRK
jgi:Fe-S-cluster-containing hydrogenase component 2